MASSRLIARIYSAGVAGFCIANVIVTFVHATEARPGQVDPTFRPGAGDNGSIRAIIALPNDQLVIGGDFTTFGHDHLARLNADGSLDSSFKATLNGSAGALEMQVDGKLVVAGSFLQANGAPRATIARFLPDGALDGSFLPGSGPNAPIECIALDREGRILIGGTFSKVNGANRAGFARLQPNGALETNFIPTFATGFSPSVTSIVCYPDGRILLAGRFSRGLDERGWKSFLARLKNDGSIDESFTGGPAPTWSSAPSSPFLGLKLMNDGKILVSGVFDLQDTQGNRYAGLLKLQDSGELDTAFGRGGAAWGSVDSIIMQDDGKVICGGDFVSVGGPMGPGSRGLARFNPDGQLDYTFDDFWEVTYDKFGILCMALQSNGAVIIAGNIRSFYGTIFGGGKIPTVYGPSRGIARLSNAPIAPSAPIIKTPLMDTVVPQGANRLFLSTEWYSGSPLFIQWHRNGIPIPGATNLDLTLFDLSPEQEGVYTVEARNMTGITSSSCFLKVAPPPGTPGSIDLSFNFNVPGGFSPIYAAALERNGEILIGGSFGGSFSSPNFSVVPYTNLIRLTLNGSLDSSFKPALGSPSSDSVLALSVLRDGRVLAGGSFTLVNGLPRTNLAAFMPDGSLDMTFAPWIIRSGKVTQLLEQADGKILLSGEFTKVHSVTRNGIARLFPDGTLDEVFNPGLILEAKISCLALQSDGKILLAGWFSPQGGPNRPGLMRLNQDGTADSTFKPDSAMPSVLYAAVMRDGKIIASASDRTVRLTTAGAVDPTFFLQGPISRILEMTEAKYVVRTASRVFRVKANGYSEWDTNFVVTTVSPRGSLLREANGNLLIDGYASQGEIARPYMSRLFNQEPGAGSPQVRISPTNSSPYLGYEQHFGVLATGFPPPSYQWLVNSTPIEGATNQSFDLWRPTVTNSGVYSVILSNSSGSITSPPVVLNLVHGPSLPGTVDREFSPPFSGAVYAIAVQPDERIVIVGSFTNVNGTTRGHVARLLQNGEIDATFGLDQDIRFRDLSPSSTSSERIFAVETVLVQADGRILIGGEFSSIGDMEVEGLARLNTNGTLDRSFAPSRGQTAARFGSGGLALDQESRIIAPAYFQSGSNRIGSIVRIQNGAVDTTFRPEIADNSAIRSIHLDQDGNILVAAKILYRVFRDGKTLPLSGLNPGSDLSGVTAVTIQPNGKILFGRTDFQRSGGVTHILQRISPSGTLDDNYSARIPEPKSDHYVSDLLTQPDGRTIVLETGLFNRNRVVRLNPRGEIDPEFNPSITDGRCLALQADGKILVGTARGVQRIHPGEPLPNLTVSLENGRPIARWPPFLEGFILESSVSLDPPNWTQIANMTNSAAIPTSSKTLFLRLRKAGK